MRRLAVLALLALLGAGCGGGGGGSASPSDIAGAAKKTARSGSLEADFAISGAGLNGNGSGVFNTGESRSGQLTMTVTAGGRQIPVETIVAGNVLYMRSSVFAQTLTEGKQWIKVDLAELAKQRGTDLSSFLNASPTPTNALAYLAGASDVKKVGSESVQGTKTTHYEVTVDLQRAASRAKGTVRASLERAISQSRLKMLPLDVWVDGSGYIRKVNYEERAGGGQPAEVTMELHDFGTSVSIKPPPSGSVVDLMKTLQQGG
jgi:LppX_LprAFG lipoprotein